MEYQCPFCSNIIELNTIENEHKKQGRFICKKCGRLLKLCHHAITNRNNNCKLINKAVARFCQYCGQPFTQDKSSEASSMFNWVQDGKDALRSSFSQGDFPLNAGLFEKSRYPKNSNKFSFFEQDDTSDLEKISLPGLIIYEDLIIYFNYKKHCFIALSIGTKELEFQWKCSFEDYVIDRNSTPVAYNGFLYVITTAPKLIHRISLDNGNREILSLCAMNEERKPYYELEGRNFKDFSPILIGHPNKLCTAPCLFYITKEHTWAIDLSDDSYDAINSSIRGWHFNHKPFMEEEISRPVFIDDYMISTLLTDSHSGFQFFDLSAFPLKFETKKILPRDYANDRKDIFSSFIETDKWKNTPCIASKENDKFIVTWFAFSQDYHSFAAIEFEGLNKISVRNQRKDNKAFDKQIWQDSEKLIPIRIEGQNYIGMSDQRDHFIFKDFSDQEGKRICKSQTPYLFKYAIPINKHGIFLPFGQNSVTVMDTVSGSHENEQKLYDGEIIINKPVIRKNNIFLQTSKGIVCISIGNDN